MYLAKITKEEINAMPVVAFEGEITVVDSLGQVEEAVEELRRHAVLGIDTETKPSFTKGKVNQVALLQVATDDLCFLFRLNKIGFPAPLESLLANRRIKKVGLSLHDDMAGLRKVHKFKPAGLVDIQDMVKRYGILELGLQKIFAIIFAQKISKSQQLSNWENAVLTEPQQRYAATDAWACLKIYHRLLQETPLPADEVERLVQAYAQG